MSIPNIIHKIKSKSGIDKITIMYLFIIVGVGISSFGLGRMSIDNSAINDNIRIESSSLNLSEYKEIEDSNILKMETVGEKEKRYVASKNGKMYYTLGCSGASRIKLENQIWFSTSEDAEKSGYTLASSCH